MELQAILNYQEIDKKLYALERELAGCEERKEYIKAKKFLESAADKLDAYDAKAAQLKSEAVGLTKKYLAARGYPQGFRQPRRAGGGRGGHFFL